MKSVYVVCGSKSWNEEVFEKKISKLSGTWHFIATKEELTLDALKKINPRYVFFLHWSWIVPEEIVAAFECVNFHMTDLPYGRGGSPLQNLILRGHTETMLTAHRMTKELDAGGIYAKIPMSLDGTAEEILHRSGDLSIHMIEQIIHEEPDLEEQIGDVVIFKRRTPEESELPEHATPKELYNFIRMLDGEGYPRAFLRKNGFRYEFYSATLADGSVSANVNITPDHST